MRLSVCLSTGTTKTFELPDELPAWHEQATDSRFLAAIRSISILRAGTTFALAVPRAFGHICPVVEASFAENGTLASIRVGYSADEIMTSCTVYVKNPVARYDVSRTGRARWLPDR